MTPNPCSACGGTTFVRAAIMERSGENNRLYPLAITFRRGVEFRSFFSFEQVETEEPDPDKPAGALEVLFCRACGKVDWFVKNPGDVPIGGNFGTELVEAAPAAPYR